MIKSLTNSGSLPTLERLMQFAGQRHRLIVTNIANLSTPGFRPSDVSPESFQAQLADAVDARRRAGHAPGNAAGGRALVPGMPASGGGGGGLPMRSTRQIEVAPDRLILHPEPMDENILFHDGNDRSVERIMQDLVENFMTYRMAAQFMRGKLEQLKTAIRERV